MEKKEVTEERDALKEKNKMTKLVSEGDIIELNVGGKKMTCKRSTLTQVPGSLLEAMFSGRWESQLELTKKGQVFLDFDPFYFRLILNYLRTKRLGTPVLPIVSQDQLAQYQVLVTYLGLDQELLVITVTPTTEIFHHDSDTWQTFTSKTSFASGQLHSWKVHVDKFVKGVNTWGIVVGITAEPLNTLNWHKNTRDWGYIGLSGKLCKKDGSCSAFGKTFGEKDVITIQLDLRDQENFYIECLKNDVSQGSFTLGSAGPYYAVVRLACTDASVRLVL